MQNREGQQLGNYRLKRRLDGGGYADVYLAEQIYLGMEVAIKVLKSPTLLPEERQKFLDEAKIVARLDHPHIVKILEFGIETSQQEARNTPYLVMDFASKGTLRKLHPRGARVPLDKITLYVRQIADALEYAHNTHSIVHRDIKPENMLIKRADHILLSDFGIAVAGFTTGNLSKQFALISANKDLVVIPGTPTYIAPERLGDRPIQRSSDQYSLAVVVYEWLTGTAPFTGSETEICYKHLNALPPSLSKAPHNIAPEIEDVVMKALAKKPEFRYKTVKDFATELDAAVRTVNARQSQLAAPYHPPPLNQAPPWIAQQQQPAQAAPPWIAQQQPAQPPAAQAPAQAPAPANLPPWQSAQPATSQLSQAQTQVPLRQQQPANSPSSGPPPTQTPSPSVSPIPGPQATGAQMRLFQQTPSPGPGMQKMPPQSTPAQGQPAVQPPATQGLPPQGTVNTPPANTGPGHTWAIAGAGPQWRQAGYIPLNASDNATSRDISQHGLASTPYNAPTSDMAATAREFSDGFNKARRGLRSVVELDFGFFKSRRFRVFRRLGFAANILSVTLVGLFVLHDWWAWLFGIILSLLGLFICIAAVRKPIAIAGGVLVAIWWMYVGYGIDLIWPVTWMRPPTAIPQIIFFSVSALIHTLYAMQKND